MFVGSSKYMPNICTVKQLAGGRCAGWWRSGSYPAGAGNPVTAIDLVSSAGPGKVKVGIWLRGGRMLRRCRFSVTTIRLPRSTPGIRLARVARPVRPRQGRRDPDPAPSGRRAPAPGQHPELHKAWPASRLVVVDDAGHFGGSMGEQFTAAIDAMADQLHPRIEPPKGARSPVPGARPRVFSRL